MNERDNVYGRCESCGNEVHGDFIVFSGELPDRDFILCDGCGILHCRNCAHYWQTGYCDRCLHAAEDEDMELFLPDEEAEASLEAPSKERHHSDGQETA